MKQHPIVISDTTQEFLGRRYYLCGRYFQDAGKRLHRAVWEHHNGAIPKGMHVHHKDEDRCNNRIDNLELMSASKHMEHHMSSEERIASAREALKIGQLAAPAWHASAEGKEWHRQNWEKMKHHLFKKIRATCTCCGREYEATDNGKDHKFCSKNCKAQARRDSGIDNIEKTCQRCGGKFMHNKYAKRKFCFACQEDRVNALRSQS
jgi:hypothetical protein